MSDLSSWAERRRAVRVPVRGVAVFHADEGPLHGNLENLSHGGALVSVASRPSDETHDVELRFSDGSGWVIAHTVRSERSAAHWRIGIEFDRVESVMRQTIDASIHDALAAARRRPILVIDDHAERRRELISLLAARGMTPLAPKTPLDAIDLLTRTQLHVTVCLLAPTVGGSGGGFGGGFGVATTDLHAVIADSFPWVTVSEISDDLEATAHNAIDAWSSTPVARMGTAIG